MHQNSELVSDVQPASNGAGELLQRDYWAVIDDCRFSPRALVEDLRERFCEFPPEDFVAFQRAGKCDQPLEVGDELEIVIRMAVECRVRVVCRDQRSITLATLSGHPEAGRITFGAYRHDSGAVVFHIRSRSRSGNAGFSAGFLAIGEAMQTDTWTDFVATVASTYGSGVHGEVYAETEPVRPNADDDAICKATFETTGAD